MDGAIGDVGEVEAERHLPTGKVNYVREIKKLIMGEKFGYALISEVNQTNLRVTYNVLRLLTWLYVYRKIRRVLQLSCYTG